jgi:DNA gyrase subunit A
MKITDKTGALVAIKAVNDSDDLMIINRSGITIRLRVADLRTIGRATQGVRLLKISEGDAISSVAKVEAEDKVEEALAEEATPVEAGNADSPTESDLGALSDPDALSSN